MIRILRATVALLGAVTLVGGLVGQGRAAADGGPIQPAVQAAGDHFETYDHDYGPYCRCRYEREFRGGYQCYDGYYRPYDDRYYHSYDHRYHDGCRRYYYDDRYYDDRYYHDRYYYHHGDHGDDDGDRDFPDRRRGRNHGDD